MYTANKKIKMIIKTIIVLEVRLLLVNSKPGRRILILSWGLSSRWEGVFFLGIAGQNRFLIKKCIYIKDERTFRFVIVKKMLFLKNIYAPSRLLMCPY